MPCDECVARAQTSAIRRVTLLARAGPGKAAVAGFDRGHFFIFAARSALRGEDVVVSAGSSLKIEQFVVSVDALRFFFGRPARLFFLLRTESNFGAFARSTSFQSPMRMS